MPVTYLDLGTFQWGQGEHGDGLLLAENVGLAYGLKRPIEAPEATSGTLADLTLNSIYVHVWPANPSAASYTGDAMTEFHGAKTAIYVYNRTTDTFSTVRTGLAAAGEPPAGRFASYGNDVWYTNRIDDLQVRANNTGNFVAGTGASVFKPVARDLCMVKNYMLAFDLANATFGPDYYAWSVPGNPAVWDAAASGGGGTGRITSRPGQIVRAIGGEFARVFKRASMHSLQFTGDVVGTNGGTWREDILSSTIGTPYPSSVVEGDQGTLYFLGNDLYFYQQVGASPPQRISPYAVSAYLSDFRFSKGAIDPNEPTTMAQEDLWVVGTYHPSTGCAVWYYRAVGDSETEKRRGVMYSTVTQEFTTLTHAIPQAAVGSIGSLPRRFSGDYDENTYSGLIFVGTSSAGGATVKRYTFSSSAVLPVRLITRKQALGMSGLDSLNVSAPAVVRRILPVPSTRLPDESSFVYEACPVGLGVTVHVSNDPAFKQVSGVNPRSEKAIVGINSDEDSDALPYTESQGLWQVFEVTYNNTDAVAAGGTAELSFRALPALWIEHEAAT